MKKMIWLVAALTGGVVTTALIAQEDLPPSPSPQTEQINLAQKEKRYQAVLADLRARVEALEKSLADRRLERPDLPSNQPLPPPKLKRLAPEAKAKAERRRFEAIPAPDRQPREFAPPLQKLGLPPEQMEALRNRFAEMREKQMNLREKLMDARRALQEAACEQRINEEVIKEHALRVGKIEAEMAMTRGKLVRELREKLPPEKFERLMSFFKRNLDNMPVWQPPFQPQELRRPEARPDRRPMPPREDMGRRHPDRPDRF